jgi:quinol monooxygenase YgiN
MNKYVYALALPLLAAVSTLAQTPSGNIAAIQSQTPKNGMIQQYEQGRKEKAAWHKQQNDPQPLYVFETMSGDNTGTYLVGRLDQHWADFDKPVIPDQADTEEFNKVVGNYVQSVTDRYYEFLAKISNPDTSTTGPAKFDELVTFRVHREKIAEFQAALAKVAEAVQKTKWPVHYEFYELVNGGYLGTFVLAEPHANWADFEDNPGVKPFHDMLREAFGPAEGDSVYDRVEGAIESEYSEIVQFRPDLSYIPGKQLSQR